MIRFGDDEERIEVSRERPNLIVGPDTPLIRLCHMLRVSDRLPTLDDLTFNGVFRLGLYSSLHVIDCRPEDPDNYRVVYYGANARLEGGRQFQGRRFGEATWAPLRPYVASEYRRVKTSGRMDVADVSYTTDGRSVSYRRLLLPLAGGGREVSHLLMGFLHH